MEKSSILEFISYVLVINIECSRLSESQFFKKSEIGEFDRILSEGSYRSAPKVPRNPLDWHGKGVSEGVLWAFGQVILQCQGHPFALEIP